MTIGDAIAPQSESRFVGRWRYYITGTLTAESPIHIGSLDGATIDMPVSVDGMGTPVIPGTALAGVLRDSNDDWGSRDRKSRVTSTSRITIHDAPLSNRQPVTELRKGVSINRYTGAAQPGFLYDMEVLPAGSEFAFCCTLESARPNWVRNPGDGSDSNQNASDARDWDGLPATVKQLIANAASGFAVGRKTSTGLGKLRLVAPAVKCRDLTSRDHLLARLAERNVCDGTLPDGTPLPSLPQVAAPIGGVEPAPGVLRIKVPWRANGPVLVADNPIGDAVDTVPVTTREGDLVRLVVPGSSIRGVLRSQAERILRTVLNVRSFSDPSSQLDMRQAHVDDLAATEGMALVAALFGTAGDSSKPRGQSGRKGALTVGECRTAISWDWVKWDRVCSASKTDPKDGRPQDELLKALAELEESSLPKHESKCGVGRFLIGDHVAIDRWTGGAADGALYSVLEPWLTNDGDWEPVTIDVDWSRLMAFRTGNDGDADGNLALAALALLLLTVQDFCDGLIPLGFGAAKGYGSVAADASKVEIPLPEALCPATATEPAAGANAATQPDPKTATVNLAELLNPSATHTVRRQLTDAWQEWIDRWPAPKNGVPE